MGRPRLRTETLRQRFVDEAILLIETEGIEAITTRGIAERSESSLAALNELFGGKAGLVSAAALHGFSLLATAIDVDIDAGTVDALVSGPAGGPGGERAGGAMTAVAGLCRAHREFSRANPRLLALMYSRPFAEFGPDDQDRVVAAAIRRRFTAAVATAVGEPANSRTVNDSAIGLVALLEGLTRQERAGTLGSTVASMDRRWTAALDTYLSGMLAANGRSA